MRDDWQRLQQLKHQVSVLLMHPSRKAKSSQHRQRPLYSSQTRNQQQSADNATPEMEAIWFCNMKTVMWEIDWATNGTALPLTGNGPFRFLDLGRVRRLPRSGQAFAHLWCSRCCPGGFSSYILEKNYDARGVGVSLHPVRLG